MSITPNEPILDDSLPTIEERRRHLEESGRRAGWDDPEMDIYDHYDENRKKMFGDGRCSVVGAEDCGPIAAIVGQLGCRSPIKLRGAAEPEPWAAWLITPAAGYLEPDRCGPWLIRDVEWVEVAPVPHDPATVVAAFAAAGLPATVVAGNVRVPARG